MKYLPVLFLFCAAYLFADEVGINEKAFTRIYQTGEWGRNADGEGYSGPGSTPEAAAPYMQFLVDFLQSNHIQSVIDLGCGDWTFSQHIQWGAIHYTGIDVVKHVIERNKERFSSPTVRFIHMDGTLSELPAADLLICKDVLQHMTNKDVEAVLKQAAKYKHCIFVNDVDEGTFSCHNQDVHSGGYRHLDITQPPFNIDGIKIFHFKAKEEKRTCKKQVLYFRGKG